MSSPEARGDLFDIERIARQINELCNAVLRHPGKMANRERLFSELGTHTTSLSDQVLQLQIAPLLALVDQIMAQADIVEQKIAHSWARAPDDPNAASAIDRAVQDLLGGLSVLRDRLAQAQLHQELVRSARFTSRRPAP